MESKKGNKYENRCTEENLTVLKDIKKKGNI